MSEQKERVPGEVLHEELREKGLAAGSWDQQTEMYRASMVVIATRLGVPSSGSMTRAEALTMLAGYSEIIPELRGMRGRFPEGGSTAKAMRWLGYAQGVCGALGYFSVGALKEHSRLRVDVRKEALSALGSVVRVERAEVRAEFFREQLRRGYHVRMRKQGLPGGERVSTVARFDQLLAEGETPALLTEIEVLVSDSDEARYLRSLVGLVPLAVRGMFLRPAQHPQQVGAAPITKGSVVATPQGAEVVVGGDGDSVYTEHPDGGGVGGMSDSLTPGERAVWAAAFAARYRECALDKPARIHSRDDAAWEEWELTCADNAAEWASFVVQRARESLPRVREGWGEDSGTAAMLADMLGATRGRTEEVVRSAELAAPLPLVSRVTQTPTGRTLHTSRAYDPAHVVEFNVIEGSLSPGEAWLAERSPVVGLAPLAVRDAWRAFGLRELSRYAAVLEGTDAERAAICRALSEGEGYAMGALDVRIDERDARLVLHNGKVSVSVAGRALTKSEIKAQ